MIKKAIALGIILLNLNSAFGQKEENQKNVYSNPSSDFLMIHFQNEFWFDAPDTIKKNTYSPSFGMYVNKDFGIKKSNFSVSLGIGFSSSNIKLKDQKLGLTDSGSSMTFLSDSGIDYKRYKYTQGYLEVPIELRYFTNKEDRNKGFKATLGLKVGNLLSAHTKGVYLINGVGSFKTKDFSKRFAESWRMTPYLRLGWGNYSIMASYQITTVFKSNQGPEVHPVLLGICVTGL